MSMVFFPWMMIKKILVFWDCVRNSYELMLCCWSRKKKEKNINFTVVCLSLSIMVLFHYYVCLGVFHLFKVMLSKFIAIPQKTQKQTYWYEFKRTNQGWGILPKCTNLIKKLYEAISIHHFQINIEIILIFDAWILQIHPTYLHRHESHDMTRVWQWGPCCCANFASDTCNILEFLNSNYFKFFEFLNSCCNILAT